MWLKLNGWDLTRANKPYIDKNKRERERVSDLTDSSLAQYWNTDEKSTPRQTLAI